MRSPSRERIESHLSVDEVGLETAWLGRFLLKSAFQPIFRARGDWLVPDAVEALARPSRDGASSDAETCFAALDLDLASVADAVCQTMHLRNFQNLEWDDLRLFVNIGIAGARETSLQTPGELPLTEIDPTRLIYELGPGVQTHAPAVTRLTSAIASIGARSAIDRFGADPASLELVRQVAPRFVKVDGGWLRQVARLDAARKLARVLFDRLHMSGCEVIVTCVETQADLDTALDLGADLVQGFLLGHPMVAGTSWDLDPLPLSGNAKSATA